MFLVVYRPIVAMHSTVVVTSIDSTDEVLFSLTLVKKDNYALLHPYKKKGAY